MLDDFISKNILHSQEEFNKTIYKEAAIRLFKNRNPPENVTKLAKLKLPRLIELLSNAPHHIIEQMIRSNTKGNPIQLKQCTQKKKSYLIYY